ncbi:Coq4-domain-containing protein [Guyanagaster necrorhizus]|uniref:4-hydroxy-3-methoxy-5-polyprenylbenzoate decarboxylase n=1 Tax=Guyanagaster necrorhizus TaxID=856835 RepID=A0A9P7W160_9AGAR|nr:Coq4-domain-containing protein [Guyanagaster necrorhizus MCA 3950]KAG7451396.1 Coq4-domain-containing protein [Guyanagaster necrorhizus MCA 3950]
MSSLCRLASRAVSKKTPYPSFCPGSSRLLATAPAYPSHIPLTWFENTFLLVGAGLMTLADPRRGDLVAVVGETSAGPSLRRLRDIMLESSEGRRILKQRPRINTTTLDMNNLAQLPEGTFGRAYTSWLERCRVTPDTRAPVHYIDDPELAYVMQRYRECHDFYHCICNMPVNVESELAIKYFELANLGLPMAGFSAALYPWRLNSAKRHKVFSEYAPWALKCGSSARSLITVFWEERWDQNVEEMKTEFGIWDGPPAKWPKPLKGTGEKQARTEVVEKSLSSDV